MKLLTGNHKRREIVTVYNEIANRPMNRPREKDGEKDTLTAIDVLC